ncbi:MAG: dihydroorotate dehydrogenase [Phycisphaerales bacterium]
MAGPDPNLRTVLAGTALSTPLVAAAGTCGSLDELSDAFDLRWLGAVTTKSITVEPRDGNAPWRIIDVPGGMMNAIGLANVGLDAFLRDKAPHAGRMACPAFGSVAGHAVDEYVRMADAFDRLTGFPVIELNVSCPNTATGLQFGDDPSALRALIAEVRPAVRRAKLFVKVSPNADVVRLSEAAVAGGADGLTLVNTFTAMSIDVHTRRPRLSRGRGGLSGPGIHPIAVRMVHDVHRAVAGPAKVPIIGLGGTLRWEDAAEFILAGATAVGVGTALFVDPRSPVALAKGLARWVRDQGAREVGELVGALEA